ncbi:phage tail tape measure C-terminal domain-containing protein, partial [Iodidimonas muriae]|uniref:phage tail tape measure C-terminal domain-containing protein n=1 Tax=Iodidimonas muriae TaxID=261467 RepID=UPI001663FC72
AGLAAGAALAGVGLVLARGIAEAAEAERSYRRLEAVLRATGFASGLTARDIAGFADEMERSTLASAEAVQDAAAVLATFRSVAGATFTRAIRLAQDLSAVFGQDLRSSATQLGKALEEPVQGISALRRVGVSFTASQKELIESLVETGRTAEAQKVILDALEQQVGGAGAAEAGGLTGAANRLSDAWGNLLESIGRTPAVSGTAETSLNLLARSLEGLATLFEEDPISVQIVEANKALIEAEDKLARFQDQGRGRAVVQLAELRVEQLRAEVDALIARARQESQVFSEEQRRAEGGRRAAESERLGELLSTQRGSIDRALDQLATDPAERIAKVNRELDETKKKLEALRAPDGGNAVDVDAALGNAEELARRRIEAIERPAQEAARRVAEANMKVVDDLAGQLAGLADERAAFIDQALSRLSDGATDAQRAEVERLAGALFDEKAAREALAEAMRAEDRLRQEGARIIAATRTPAEDYAATLERLNMLLQAGAIDQDSFNRALGEADTAFADARDRMLAESRDFGDGVDRAVRDIADRATDAAAAAETVTRNLFAGMEDALVSFVTTGKLQFGDFARAIIADIARIAIRQAIIAPLLGAIGGGTGGGGGLFAGLFHAGGVVGRDTGPARLVPTDAFIGAPHFARGGVVGPDEVPAILHRGEAVLTPAQMAMLGERLSAREAGIPSVVINFNGPVSNAAEVRRSAAQAAANLARMVSAGRRGL